MVDTSVDHATGAARRQRERRLRAYLRYARMSVAKAMAEATHHTAPRGQRTARAREEGRDEMNFAMGLTTPAPEAASTQNFTLDDDGDVVAARAATGSGKAARCGADYLDFRACSGSRCSSAADGESGGGRGAGDRHGDPGAGHQCAQDLSGPNPAAFCGTSYAEC